MPEENPYLQAILVEMQSVNAAWEELLKPPFAIKEVALLVKTITKAAQTVINAPSSGADRHAAAKAAFLYLDQKYHLVQKIDSAIPLPIFLEPFDGPAIRGAVDILITAVVAGWKDSQ